jgi:catechol 2,3-dioxygenase-like lactoylglutathione lyase family enzyme
MTSFRVGLMTGLLAVSLFGQTAPESPIVGVGPFLHIISDLDESLKFYHDALGLELRGPPGEHRFTNNPAVANLYGVPGKQFRAAVLIIPGSPMGIELVQWGEAREPENKGIADPGAVTLILRVTDANAIVARAVKAKLSMMRSNGGPPTLHDPDGFAVQVLQSDSPGADLSVGVSDVTKTAALYNKTLGFKVEIDGLTVPGTSMKIHLHSVGGTEGLAVPFPTPGRGMLRLPTRNIAAVTESLKGAGLPVITTGGAPVSLPQGPQVVILRDPNNFYLQLMEAPAPK